MNTLQYLEATRVVFNRVNARIATIGDAQYSLGERQQFEDLPYDQIINNAQEELEDLIAYASQLHIRLEEVKKVLLRRQNV
jgi:hypothetical protein